MVGSAPETEITSTSGSTAVVANLRSIRTCRHRRLPGRHRAFTLLELLIVILIMGILAGIAVPKFSTITVRYSLDAASQRIQLDLERAASQAKQKSGLIPVYFTVGNRGGYQIVGIPDLRDPTKNYQVLLDRPPYQVTVDTANFGGDRTIEFNGFGLPDSEGQVVISAGNESRTILIDANGKISWN